MATIYKRTRKARIPAGAEIIERKRKATAAELKENPERLQVVERFAVWTRGKQQRRAPLTPDGKGVFLESPGYRIEYFDHNGDRKKKATRCSDRDAVERLAAELEKGAMFRREGYIDSAQERLTHEARRPLAEHQAEYERFLTDKGNTPKHVSETMRSIRRVVGLCGAEVAADLTGPAVMEAIGGMREAGSSPRTCNSYLTATKGMTRWLRLHKRTADDTLCSLSSYNEETDRRHVRRELDTEEIGRLLATAEKRTEPGHNLCGSDRSMCYRLAMGTGFRAKELRSLTPESFDLDDNPPVVIVAAAYSKHRREDRQPIRRDLADLLRPWLVDKPRGERLFGRLPGGTARMLRGDLAAARREWLDEAPSDGARKAREKTDFLEYENAAGEFADFHATRHTYISGIVAGGASVKTAQELARHSDPALTIGRYSHARPRDLQTALDALPGVKPAPRTVAPGESSRPTGTDGAQVAPNPGAPVEKVWAQKWAHSSGERGQNTAKNTPPGVAGTPPTRSEKGASCYAPQVESLAGFRQPLAATGQERRARDSNPQPVARHLISRRIATPGFPEENGAFSIVGAKVGALLSDPTPADSELAMIVERWESLPAAVRAGIVETVRAAAPAQ